MKKLQNNSMLPYPVLCVDNKDVMPNTATVSISTQAKGDSFVFTAQLMILNTTIKRLIEENKAKYLFVMTCPTTALQKKEMSKEPELSIEVDRFSVCGHLDFDCYVVLTEDTSYSNIGFSAIYEGLSFDLEAGNILVRFPHVDTNMDYSNEKLFASNAFVEFLKNNKDEVEFQFDLDIIYISLPAKQYNQYQEIRNNSLYSDLLISSIVHEAIVLAIINYDEERHGTLGWADALNTLIYLATGKKRSLKNMQPDERIRDAWYLTNLVFKNPHERLFDSIIKIDSTLNPTE